MKSKTKKSSAKKVIKKAASKKTSSKKPAKKNVKKAVKKISKKSIARSSKDIKKNKKNLSPKETHYILILDESGSMFSVRENTLNGVNEQIQTIRNLDKKYPDQKYFINVVKFSNSEVVPLIENVPAKKVKDLTLESYVPDGGTPLYDAIGISVTTLKERIKNKLKSGKASALVVILTDGAENQSSIERWKDADFNDPAKKIRSLIVELSKDNLWTFTFIGANQDAVLTAQNLGVNINNVANYTSTQAGTSLAFRSISSAMSRRASYAKAGVYAANTQNFMSEVTCGLGDIGEDATKLNLSEEVTAEEIEKAKQSLDDQNSSN